MRIALDAMGGDFAPGPNIDGAVAALQAYHELQVVLVGAIPLTGVGKVFKPQLRWDAAKAVFAQLLAPLAAGGIAIEVKVAADGTHGTLATISLTAAHSDDAARANLEAQVRARMSPFTIRHQITWAT